MHDFSYCVYCTHTVASPPRDVAAELVSPTTIRVTWSPPSGRTTVTGYEVVYSSPSDTGSVRVDSTSTDTVITLNQPASSLYNVTVIALSTLLSGVSNHTTAKAVFCKLVQPQNFVSVITNFSIFCHSERSSYQLSSHLPSDTEVHSCL